MIKIEDQNVTESKNSKSFLVNIIIVRREGSLKYINI